MKPRNTRPPGLGPAGLGRSSVRIPSIPMEWMDPMSWRLPSGKALAEFWLQSGFLAPLMLGSPAVKRKKASVPAADRAPYASKAATGVMAAKKVEEVPEHSGTFREIR